MAQLAPPKDDYDDDDDDDDDDESDSEGSVGSLVDFVVDNEVAEEPVKEESDGIDPRNIVSGKRMRKQTEFFEQQVFASAEYRRMVLCDVPPDELEAAVGSGDDSDADDNEEDDDASFAIQSDHDSVDDDCSDISDDESCDAADDESRDAVDAAVSKVDAASESVVDASNPPVDQAKVEIDQAA